jgi:peptidyl-prolyl cis-trans isomerase C
MPSPAQTAIAGIAGAIVGAAAVYFLAPQTAAPPAARPSPVAGLSVDHSKDPIVAKVDGTPIYKSDVDDLIAQLPDQVRQMPEPELRQRVTGRLIDVKLAADRAVAERIDQDPKTKERLHSNDQQLLADVYLDRTARSKINDTVLQAKYDELVKQVPPLEEVHARHILVKTEAEAKDIVKQLDKGADFEKLAKEKSTDPGSGESGGDLGYFTKDKMVPEFADAAFKMDKGQYSKTPVHSQFGWHIIQVLDKRTQPPPPFDQVKAQLTNIVLQDEEGKLMADLRKGIKIELFNPGGSPIAPETAPPAVAPAAPAAAPAAPAAPPAPAKN